MKQYNFNDNKMNLTESDIDQLVDLLTPHCRHKTKLRLRSVLTYGKGTIGNYGIFNRLIKESGQWCYVAGQSYPDEIRSVRMLIMNGD